ncbi:MAG: PAS domain S-box protein [Anaerolineales bacterium]|nr:PAS domain S-box protein [Anaerolineales bacterium]
MTRKFEPSLIDELIIALLVIFLFTGIYAIRRWVLLSKENCVCRQAIEDLSKLNATLKAGVEGRTAEIQAEQENTKAILENIGDAIAVTDPSMIVQSINGSFSSLTGYSEEEILGQPLQVLAAESVIEENWPLSNLLEKTGGVQEGEVILRCKDGRPYDAALVLAPLHDANGDHIGYVSSHRDTSHIMELKRARNQIITNVSHELRTPVANIKLYIQLLQMGKRPDKNEHYLNVLSQQAGRLEDLIQDILEIVALDSGRGASVWKPVRLALIIDDIIEEYQYSAEISGLSLEAEPIPDDLPLVKGDQNRLSQALGELVENAITFTPAGGKVSVSTSVMEKNGRRLVSISVHDDGPGIAREEQEHIFDRFYRGSLAESGQVPGTGLGLSIVKEIITAHGGEVTVSSELDRGVTFTLWLQSVS